MKILLVCESSFKYESGGRVVRYLNKILKSKGHQVKLIVLSGKREDYELDSFYKENDIEFLPFRKNLKNRMANIALSTREIRHYKDILTSYQPEIVHFSSFDHGKPAQFITIAKKIGARVVLQPWTMQFYCEQGFGFRNEHKCNLCANGNYLNALTKKCTTLRGLPLALERTVLQKAALKADVFLSSNSELDEILKTYGVLDSQLARFPVPFDYTFMEPKAMPETDYSIFFGQPNMHKGLGVLIKVFEKLPELKLKIYPLSNLPEHTFSGDNVDVISGLSWSSGLADAIASAGIVLLPTLWSSSTEYALCEALLFKKPVILFNVGVHKHYFKNGFNALVIEPGDVDAFADAVRRMSQDPELRRVIGENGYKTLLEVNNPEKVYSQLMAAYTKNSSGIEN
ncbi:MAG: glycosyltransferase family 4 protein [Bacteroidota bacterium]